MVDVSGSGANLLSVAMRLALQPPNTNPNLNVHIGASRDNTNPPWGWSWVDGTPASNLNCNSKNCGPWSGGSPTYVLAENIVALGSQCTRNGWFVWLCVCTSVCTGFSCFGVQVVACIPYPCARVCESV